MQGSSLQNMRICLMILLRLYQGVHSSQRYIVMRSVTQKSLFVAAASWDLSISFVKIKGIKEQARSLAESSRTTKNAVSQYNHRSDALDKQDCDHIMDGLLGSFAVLHDALL
ncbi:hypothetical protein Patl1_26468 [Pistacia atlantica]|uniref:Uncharacterized protein n=1 Tax=Pistacia atlantica TaxID=434234 RepID=A0ACC1B286_9ROSI|nr:hypothetical protein Patl1_26468 [Pistacia atlantica]